MASVLLRRQLLTQAVIPTSVRRSSCRFASSSPKPPASSSSSSSSSSGQQGKKTSNNFAWQVGTVFAVVGAYVVVNNVMDMAQKMENDADNDVDDDQLIDKATGKPLTAITSRVFFDVSIDGHEAGRVVVGLYGNAVPKTVLNFESLARGDRTNGEGGMRLSYEGSTMHRIIPQFMIQGGDFTNHNGTGGLSIYGGSGKFDDEKNGLKLKHSGPGVLSMANSGRNTNGSQFFITTVATPWLNGKHVVFGKVFEGMDIVQLVDKTCGSPSGTPRRLVKIDKCGVLPTTVESDEE
eukprot:CAMPEP_0113446262 /NCGR_PEP_ID=MMETSP0014_2-20120614/3612_1 /TAXON_ID=2857 /ORGANISM="Nitzschia sp." /LENGTH=292 /DNA_ID=CAMNT_0000337341 /DNA_START=6 /DNA_END=884 /DNA_ORIENTATION=+ /assembly_acc=CAM_ASM_000159